MVVAEVYMIEALYFPTGNLAFLCDSTPEQIQATMRV
jgi:hypothetical protein